jgi:hypothetical protein
MKLALFLVLCMGLLTGVQEQPDTLGLYGKTECYAETMELAPWDINVFLVRDSVQIHIRAQTGADPSRWRATIVFNLASLEAVPEGEVRRTVIHELAHVLTAEVRFMSMRADSAVGDQASERLVSWIEGWDLWQELCP